jgi:hypothetical protein
MITEIANLRINGRIKAPQPFTGEATIIGFRYYTGRHTGRTAMVADYITDDGKASFDPIEKLVPSSSPSRADLLRALEDMVDEFGHYCEQGDEDPGERKILDRAIDVINKAGGACGYLQSWKEA